MTKIDEIRNRIRSEIAELEAIVSAATEADFEAARRAHEEFHAIYDGGLKGADLTRLGDLAEAASLLNKELQLEEYRQTLEADLFEATKRYVIVEFGESILSPAGISPSERVFVEPAGGVIAQVDHPSEFKVPRGTTVYAYEIKD